MFQVITVDARNHGESPHTEEMTYEAMAGDVERLLEDLGIDEASLVGHSMGGRAMMALALMKVNSANSTLAPWHPLLKCTVRSSSTYWMVYSVFD